MNKSVKTSAAERFSADTIWTTGWTYIRHVVDTAREPFLILDDKLRIMSANEAFYRTFQTLAKDTEGQLIYKLGKGQWNVPALKRLLEEVLPKQSFFRDFEIEHEYPVVGKKIMLMNAREVFEPLLKKQKSPKLIILAMEDVTKQKMLEEKLASYSKELEERVIQRTKALEERLALLEGGSKKRGGKKRR
ncbi:MAG: PAS domain-containing protein [Patescibacteria group bacterium]|nr:PAS domain-containing protein [Patescibacteria group bacterium]